MTEQVSPNAPRELSAVEREYRKDLQAMEQRSQESFDKTLVSLAGGALGVSFAFVHKFLVAGQARAAGMLLSAWLFWVLSLALVLTSHYISVLAHRKAVAEVDLNILQRGKAGGRWDSVLVWLNPAAGLAFVVGLVFAGLFVLLNIQR